MIVEEFVLRTGVHQATDTEGKVLLLAWPDGESLGVLSEGQRAALAALAEKPVDRAALRAVAELHDGPTGPGVDQLLDQLLAGNWVETRVLHQGIPRYTVCPFSQGSGEVETSTEDPLVLSRFAFLRPDNGEMVLESPTSTSLVRVHDRNLLADLGSLATKNAEHVLDNDPLSRRLCADLAVAGFLVPHSAEERELRSAQWSPHELWFHTRSRLTGSARPGVDFGTTWWARNRFDPVPAKKTFEGGESVPLVKPDLDVLRSADPSLTTVLEDRRSIRDHDDSRPITVHQVGEFLFRCARVRATSQVGDVEMSDRPYPNGGALHELELYLVVRKVADLRAGMYRYDPFEHRLQRQTEFTGITHRMLGVAARNSATAALPQLMIVISARFGRTMWKYQSMAYSLTLKHVGVLYQVMYTIATAMSLAPCALGAGDADGFASATGLDPRVEANVGEFLLGSRVADPERQP